VPSARPLEALDCFLPFQLHHTVNSGYILHNVFINQFVNCSQNRHLIIYYH